MNDNQEDQTTAITELPELKLVDSNNPILHEPVQDFDFANPAYDPIILYRALGSTMLMQGGLGLSANQVGLPVRLFVIRGKDVTPFFNPKIVWFSDATTVSQEGCLSYPYLFLKVKRSAEIRVRFADPMGVVQTQHFAGLTARVIQHETDHLNGITFVDKMKPFALQLAKDRAAKLARKHGRRAPLTYSM